MDTQPDHVIQALRLAAIVEGSDDAIVSKDVNGIIMSWNPAAERMFGYSAAEAVGRSIRIIIPLDRQHEEDLVLARIRAGERVDHFETVRRRSDGELLDVSITVSPIRAPDGRIIGASKIARDISERKRNERALEEARAEQADLRRRLTTIIDASGGLLVSPRIGDVLPAVLRVAREVLRADAYAVWHLTEHVWRMAASHGLSERFAATELPETVWARTSAFEALVIESIDDGTLPDRRDALAEEGIASMMVVPLAAGPRIGAAIAFYYRTPHAFSAVERESAAGLGRLAAAVLTTAQLYESQRRRRLESDFIAEAGAILVSTLDFREALGRLAERIVPQLADWCVFHLQNEEDRLEPVAVSAVSRIDRRLLEQFLRAADNDEREVVSVDGVVRTGTAALIDQWGGEAARGIGAGRAEAADALHVGSLLIVPLVAHGRTLGAVTLGLERGAHEFGASELRFAQDLGYRVALSIDNIVSYEAARTANRLKDEFLANLSHELRTPLNAIVGYAQMLKKGTMPEERRQRAYEVLHKNASVLTQIVEDVLDISRIVTGKIRLQLRPVPLAAIVVHSVETVQPGADAKGVHIEVAVTDAASEVAGDPDRLQQVFWNLLSNAVKFTPRNGRIVVQMLASDGVCEVLVSDNGAGIDPKFLPHIFERFRQADSRIGREHGGLGLGLAIARQIVEMHGGAITAESAGPGRGATFHVLLPALHR